jgi:hypothetical protein
MPDPSYKVVVAYFLSPVKNPSNLFHVGGLLEFVQEGVDFGAGSVSAEAPSYSTNFPVLHHDLVPAVLNKQDNLVDGAIVMALVAFRNEGLKFLEVSLVDAGG